MLSFFVEWWGGEKKNKKFFSENRKNEKKMKKKMKIMEKKLFFIYFFCRFFHLRTEKMKKFVFYVRVPVKKIFPIFPENSKNRNFQRNSKYWDLRT